MSKTKTAVKAAPKKSTKVVKSEATEVKVPRTVDVRTMSFKTKDGKIDTVNLTTAVEALIKDAAKANDGQLAAGRRFRINTINIAKAFKDLREITPKVEKK